MKMEQTECSETSAYKIQTPGNYPEESTQHSEHGESLNSGRHLSLVFPSGIVTSYYRAKIPYTLLVYPCVSNAHLFHRILFGHRKIYAVTSQHLYQNNLTNFLRRVIYPCFSYHEPNILAASSGVLFD